MKKILDGKGKEIREFDVVKVYHYTAALRREKKYMYKWVRVKDGELFGMHLSDDSGESFPLWCCVDKFTGIWIGSEIVQTSHI